MTEWDASGYAAKDNLLRVVRAEAEGLFAMAERSGAWEAPTACPNWQVRDVIGHMVDVTEEYFAGFDAARGGTEAPAPLGLQPMQDTLNDAALAFRSSSQEEMMNRIRSDFAKMMEIFSALGPDEWTGLMVPHKYMGPLPSFFYPVFQLMDYAVHSWDVRQGTGRAHGLSGDAADLLAPFMFILWQATAQPAEGTEPFEIGVRISGRNAADYRVAVGPSGLTYAPGDVSAAPAVVEFDPGSLVLTAFGRMNAGTIRGDAELGERFLNLFFRI